MVTRFPGIGDRQLPTSPGVRRVNPNAFDRTSNAQQNFGNAVQAIATGTASRIIDQQARTTQKNRLEQEKLAEDAARRARATERARVVGEASLEYEGILKKSGEEAGAGGSGLAANTALQLEAAHSKYLQDIEDPDLKAQLEVDLIGMRVRTQSTANEHEATRAAVYRRETMDATLGNLLTPVVSRPELLADVRAHGEQLIAGADFLSPEERAELKRNWGEQSVAASLGSRITEDPHDVIDELDSGEYDDDLTPASKLKMLNSAKAEIKRRVAEQEAEAKEHLRLLEKQVSAASGVLSKGYEYRDIDKLRNAVEGTELAAELDFHMKVADARQEHALRPVADQIEIMRQVQDGAQTPASVELIEALGPVTEEAAKAVQGDKVLQYAADHGVIELEPVDYADPASWGERIERSGQAAQVMGTDRANLLTDPEIAQLTDFVEGIPADEKIEWMSQVRDGLGDDGFAQIQGLFLKEEMAPGLDIAADMLGRSEKNLPAARRLLQAMELDDKELPIDKDVKKSAQMSAQESFMGGVGEVLLQQSDILSSDASRLKFMSQMNAATQKLAVANAASGRSGGFFSNAGSNAYDEMFGDYQTLTDNDAVLFVEPTVGDVDDIADGLRQIRNATVGDVLETQKPMFLSQYGPQQGERLFQEYVDDMREDGVWINGNGGAVLVDPVQGSAIARPDGTPWVVRFDEALSAFNEGE